jgi:diguanylate cyclase (GGDEF)-like protein/PAS domain S-box-containing protein
MTTQATRPDEPPSRVRAKRRGLYSALRQVKREVLPYRLAALKVAAIYLVLGSLWILASDEVVLLLWDDPQRITIVQHYKGWAFVLVTAVILFFLSQHFLAEQARQAHRLAESEGRYQQVMDTTQEGVILIDHRAYAVFCNRRFADLLGYTREELLGRSGFELVAPADRSMLARKLETRAKGRADTYEVRLLKKSGEELWVRLVATPMMDEAGSYIGSLAMISDISTQRRVEEALRHVASSDAITRLPNRLALVDRLAQTLAQAARQRSGLAVLFLDLNRFKTINETLGHRFGDALLVAVAERLRGCMGSSDLIARFDGDTFAVVLPRAASTDQVRSVAEKLLDALSTPFKILGRELGVTASIGVSLFPTDGSDVEALIRNADTALHLAKERGSNTFHFYQAEAGAERLERFELETALRRAVERDELRLYYQPQLALSNGHIDGVEALVRWQHPTLGPVSPGTFIPLAEEVGMIVPIGQWVLNTACRDIAAWNTAGLPPLRVSVNVSAPQFTGSKLVRDVEAALRSYRLEPAQLELELTESMIMKNPENTIAILQRLQSMGVRTAIDDFGTGYSSLSYLKRFSIHALKIDQSFVREIVFDASDAAITASVVELAHNLGLDVVAEGVETQSQLNYLVGRGCDRVQGYLVSQPMTLESMRTWFMDHTRRGDWLQSQQAVN